MFEWLAARGSTVRHWQWPLWAWLFSAGSIYLGTWLGYYLFSRGLDPVPGSIAEALINWDAKWYVDIASQGYHYVPGAGFGQNIIFFPLYPALIKGLSVFLPFSIPALGIVIAIIFGVLSVFLFQRLAAAWLEPDGARFATLAYAVYPAAAFFISAYPTSLMNCLAIATLLALRQQRFGLAAFWAGVGTAAGPLMVFFSFGVWLILLWEIGCKAKKSTSLGAALKSISLGILACSGLLLFMVYQWAIFRTPFAFVVAHGPFIGSVSPLQKLRNIVELYPLWGGDFTPLLHALLLQPTTLNPARSVYFLMNAAALLCSIFALGFLWRQRQCKLIILSIPLLLAYLWFQGAAQGPVSTYRLLYIDLPLFLAAGWAYQKSRRPIWSRLFLGTEMAALILQAALFISGHWAF